MLNLEKFIFYIKSNYSSIKFFDSSLDKCYSVDISRDIILITNPYDKRIYFWKDFWILSKKIWCEVWNCYILYQILLFVN